MGMKRRDWINYGLLGMITGVVGFNGWLLIINILNGYYDIAALNGIGLVVSLIALSMMFQTIRRYHEIDQIEMKVNEIDRLIRMIE